MAFAAAWILTQAALVITAHRRADRAFGFQMFNESSTLTIHLSRKVDSAPDLVPVVHGAWEAVGQDGVRRTIRWNGRVTDAGLVVFDETIHASNGIEAQLTRLQAALDDVATHSPEDAETRTLVADVVVVKNGRAPYSVRLSSVPR